jgi:uncharacterized membrane protein (DUF4010 family)
LGPETALETIEALQSLGIAFLIGLFVGLEREYALHEGMFAGARTFALIGLFGALSALLASLTSMVLLAVATGMFFLLIASTYVVAARRGDSVGMTTEVAALLVFTLGVVVFYGHVTVAVVTAVVLAITLSVKEEIRGFVSRLNEEDVVATLKFASAAFIVLPLLPDRSFGPYGGFNPFKTWLMVVLIAGVSFLGYVLTKAVGSGRGAALTGLVGGLVSSTAVTLSFAKRSKEVKEASRSFAMAILLACTMMAARVLVLVALVNQPLAAKTALPMVAITATGVLIAAWLYRTATRDVTEAPDVRNPFEMGSALKFAGLYAAISFAMKGLAATAGDTGIYVAAVLSGLADVDAVTLSLAQQAGSDLDVTVAARGVVLATMSNTAVKGGLALVLGSLVLGRTVALALGAMFVVGLASWYFL